MARVIAIGTPVNDAERAAIAHLRDHLPDTYTLLHNFEIDRQGEKFEVDIALLTPHALYLIDVKGTRGNVDVYGNKWFPENRAPFPSPLPKLRSHARTLKGLIVQAHPGRSELDGVFVDAAVVLTANDAHLTDRNQIDSNQVVKLRDSERFFKDSTSVPSRFSKNILNYQALILHALNVAKPVRRQSQFGHWEVTENLGSTVYYTEYRAQNTHAAGGTARVRVYKVDPYLPESDRAAEANLISNAYQLLARLPTHPNIVAAKDFFKSEDDDAYVLVIEDPIGQALTVHMARQQLALTVDQKWRVAKDLLAGLSHCHKHGVVHRNLTLGAILVGLDGVTRLTDFDFAKPSVERSQTIAGEIVSKIEKAYVAPEAYQDPAAATSASDIFSAGLVLYELFTGERPFAGDPSTVWDQAALFPVLPSSLRPELNEAFDAWLQSLCAFEPDARPSGHFALKQLEAILQAPSPESSQKSAVVEASSPEPEVDDQTDYFNLQAGYSLTRKFSVEKKLGRGSFGVVYKVIDTLGDVARTVKLILSDRHSTLERLKTEYRNLVHIPEHPYVVRVLDADIIPGRDIPFLVFEYVEGADIADMIQRRLLSPDDALELGKQVVAGLHHLHTHGFHHCDIKPSNLLWTNRGAKIIDFNVSTRVGDSYSRGGGSRKYLPPDFDTSSIPHNGERADRDLYALGLTLYEALTGKYPWETSEPPIAITAPDPRELSGFDDLAPELVAVVLKAISPRRAERFHSAEEFQDVISEIHHARRPRQKRAGPPEGGSQGLKIPPSRPNTNVFVSHLRTLYSQSRTSNSGTRGLDVAEFTTYVATDLDKKLLPAVLDGEFQLVVISGNAGDGKTAFLQQLESEVELRGGAVNRDLPNGSELRLGDRRFFINYDGSQDEGTRDNDDVLKAFLSPFEGEQASWNSNETRLIAINEGRLVDFLATHEKQFVALTSVVHSGFRTGEAVNGIAVINLNLRSVIAPESDGSILERTLLNLVNPDYWEACEGCSLKNSCYAHHNAKSFQDKIAGPQLLERLRTVYTMAHLRGRLHITMRDLRSALSFMLIGDRSCEEIHELYSRGDHEQIARGYYFNSWLGAGEPNGDRLIQLLAGLDVGRQEDPQFDRSLDFILPDDRSLFRFEYRDQYDQEVFKRLFGELPRSLAGTTIRSRATQHRKYVAMARRKQFFERRDTNWETMLPYQSAKRMVEIVLGKSPPRGLTTELISAINRGEGLFRPERIGDSLALQVRQVEHGTIRSYRLFPLTGFELLVEDHADKARFVEHLPTGLTLRFKGEGRGAITSSLSINLDVFEMLTRLNHGYQPSVEEIQGFYLCLAVFKNSLNSQPYKEILLTTTGHDFFRMTRNKDATIELSVVPVTGNALISDGGG